jgi:hypothetical protein
MCLEILLACGVPNETLEAKPTKNLKDDVHTRDNMLNMLTRRHFNPI